MKNLKIVLIALIALLGSAVSFQALAVWSSMTFQNPLGLPSANLSTISPSDCMHPVYPDSVSTTGVKIAPGGSFKVQMKDNISSRRIWDCKKADQTFSLVWYGDFTHQCQIKYSDDMPSVVDSTTCPGFIITVEPNSPDPNEPNRIITPSPELITKILAEKAQIK